MLQKILLDIQAAGGRAYYIGGYVRDSILGVPSKDIDVEVHRLTLEQLEEILSRHGEVDLVGKSFGILILKGLDVDWSLPRTENKVAEGHRGFEVQVRPFMGVREAARRRDFTMNAISQDCITGEIVDPFGGKKDLEQRVLRVVDPATFVEDPLRVLRGAQFCARFGLWPDSQTLSLCRDLRPEASSLSKERVAEELKKLLLKGRTPSLGLEFLRACGWLHELFPELSRLQGVPQDPEHHPEGDVWVHTLQVVDRAAELRDQIPAEDRLVFMLAALLHDVGKYRRTFYKTPDGSLVHWTAARPADSRIVSYSHDVAGEEDSSALLRRIFDETVILERVPRLVRFHMSPLLLKTKSGKPFRKLAKQGAEMELLGFLSWADKGKRPDHWFSMIRSLTLTGPRETIVKGRHVLARGYKPGPKIGKIIRQCEDIFLKTGIDDPEELLDRVVGRRKREK